MALRFLGLLGIAAQPLLAQSTPSPQHPYPHNASDTVYRTEVLPVVTLVGAGETNERTCLPDAVGAQLFLGKKSDLVVLDRLPVPVVTQSMRQILAKVPGLHFWESDPSGIQVGLATRGLSPNRSWEFNVRQNGADIAADPLGYPEAYYTPPMQAVQRIQVVRGSGALQYGPQFGGTVDYILRDGSDQTRAWEGEANQSVGHYGLMNSFVGVGRKTKKAHGYAFVDRRTGDGWRANSAFETFTLHANGTIQLGNKTDVRVEATHYTMLSQQPGGLPDSLLQVDPAQSLRARNWFSTPWTTAQLRLTHLLPRGGRWETSVFTTVASRESVGFLAAISVPDTLRRSTGTWSPREVAVDHYTYGAVESRWLQPVGRHLLTAGIRGYAGKTDRKQKGLGTNASDANFEPIGAFGTRLVFGSRSASVFAEAAVRLTKRWTVVPGFRLEGLKTTGVAVPKTRTVPLAGVGSTYRWKKAEAYTNWTQNYRPLLFSELGAAALDEAIDPLLKDVTGHTAEVGFRTSGKRLRLDLAAYHLRVVDRVGRVSAVLPDGTTSILRTNTGNSRALGVEFLVDGNALPATQTHWALPFFVSGSVQDVVYTDGKYAGNKVENAPGTVVRAGLGLEHTWGKQEAPSSAGLHVQFSTVGAVYADAANTVEAPAAATIGQIPGYKLLDISAQFKPMPSVYLKLTLQNATNVRYFTRRASGYPGPGALPGDARMGVATLGIRF
jgi:Fe(3+) dicitrate transport protein